MPACSEEESETAVFLFGFERGVGVCTSSALSLGLLSPPGSISGSFLGKIFL